METLESKIQTSSSDFTNQNLEDLGLNYNNLERTIDTYKIGEVDAFYSFKPPKPINTSNYALPSGLQVHIHRDADARKIVDSKEPQKLPDGSKNPDRTVEKLDAYQSAMPDYQLKELGLPNKPFHTKEKKTK